MKELWWGSEIPTWGSNRTLFPTLVLKLCKIAFTTGSLFAEKETFLFYSELFMILCQAVVYKEDQRFFNCVCDPTVFVHLKLLPFLSDFEKKQTIQNVAVLLD